MKTKTDVARVFSAELVSLRRRRSTVVLPVAMLALAFVVYFGLETAARNNWFGIPSGFFVAASSIGWLANVVVLIGVVFTSFAISQEFALGTVKSVWVRPLSRQGWFCGKVVYACTVITLLYLLVIAVVVGLAAWRSGYVDLMEKDYLIHTAGDMGLRLLLTSALTLVSIWATVIVTAAVATRINHPGGTIAIVMGIGVSLLALSVFPMVKPLLLTTHIAKPGEQMIAMTKGLPLPLEWIDLTWQSLVVALVWMGLAYMAGRITVKNKQITS